MKSTSTKYQVFLSSTYSDLMEERDSIIKAILEMYHIPIGMEMFSAEDENQWEIIRRTIEVSDYYILVMGLRYGSKTSDGISFTQKEYEYALERKIPILAFVMMETVPLTTSKRDDDLSEINNFRKLVLTNSKMAQFWETKDQLITKVSISLMKQIMQKPGVGWIRGDNMGVDEALSKELSILIKENRELREKIVELESKVLVRLPSINVEINSPVVDDDYYSYKKIEMPNTLNFKDIEAHLHEFISEEDIDKYNSEIPSDYDLDVYNKENEMFCRIKKYSTPLRVEVSNMGTAKANNVYIHIKFPEGFHIYKNDVEVSEPRSLIPFNPIKYAQLKYNQKIKEQSSKSLNLNSLMMKSDMYNMGALTNFKELSTLNKIRPINQHRWTSLSGREIKVKIDSLLHTMCISFDDEYKMVPLMLGKHIIEVHIICEEYSGTEIKHIELEI